MSKRGPKFKLTSEIIQRIEAYLRMGAYVETAAAACGIDKATYYRALKRGSKAKSGLEWELCNVVEKAQAEGEMRDLGVIDNAAQGRKPEYMLDRAKPFKDEKGNLTYEVKVDAEGKPILLRPGQKAEWQAAAWRLERKFPRKWGRLERHEVTGEEGKAIKFEDTRADLQKIFKDKAARDALRLIQEKLDAKKEEK